MVSTFAEGYRIQYLSDPTAGGSVDSLDRYKLGGAVGTAYEVGADEYEFGPPRRCVKLAKALVHLKPAVAQLAALPWGPGHQSEFPVDKSVVDRVARFLSQYGRGMPCPSVVQTSEGGIQLEWYLPEREVELEFEPGGELILLVERNDTIWSKELGPLPKDAGIVCEALDMPLPARRGVD